MLSRSEGVSESGSPRAKSRAEGEGTPERLLTSREVAEIFRVQEQCIARWRRTGKIGYLELSRNVVRIPKSEVDRLLAEGRHGPGAEGKSKK